MIYLEKHKEIIRKELERFGRTYIRNEQIEEDFLHSEFPSKIFEDIANSIELCFRLYYIEFLLQHCNMEKIVIWTLNNLRK